MIGLAYVNPIALLPDIPAIIPKTVYAGNQFVKPHVIAAEALSLLENELTFAYVKPAIKKLADDVDKHIMDQIMKRG